MLHLVSITREAEASSFAQPASSRHGGNVSTAIAFNWLHAKHDYSESSHQAGGNHLIAPPRHEVFFVSFMAHPIAALAEDRHCSLPLRQEGVRFICGVLLAVALCLPLWVLAVWTLVHSF